ncbi:MAG: methylenetetrahydromethanopterin dehydrogenase, partial [Mesorhizobium sp.]
FCTAVIAAREGARVTLVGHDGIERVKQIAAEIKSRFNTAVDAADGSSDARKTKLVEASEVILACAKAGVQVVSKA